MSGKERLIYLPLGGAGEIGMNAYVYGYGAPGKERLILVDIGVTFPDMDTTPGVDLIYADIAWLEERRDRLEAIFITHAHEDHVGALGLAWGRLGAPVYARPFTANHAARKMEERGQDPEQVTVVDRWPYRVEAGPFEVAFLPVSHSIPESSSMVIDCPAGRIVHTGDFKLDLTPLVGEPFDRALWAEVAKPGIKVLTCDSTNVFSPHPGRSEATLGPAIRQLVERAPAMVVATTFASNIARVRTLAEAGRDAGRSVCLMGRAMRRMIEAGVESGVLTDFPTTISPEQAADIPRENLMLIVTGSQGERRAASAQLSRGKYMGLDLKEGDLFLFSSKTIPGNERDVLRIVNAFSEMGVDVVDDSADLYHVSGHANRPDLSQIHQLMKPEVVVPMHGEHRHLREHVKLAEENGLPAVLAPNGTMLDLTGKTPKVAEHVEAGRTYLDGKAQIGALDGVVRDRIRMALNGHLTVSVMLDEDDEPLGEPWVDLMGLPETVPGGAALSELLEQALDRFLSRADDKVLTDDDLLEKDLRIIARRTAENEIGKRPEVKVVISRLA
ncbi:ribonuclease J [Rhodovulum sp. ES.010]|uniref:ribonuclease J n=1 Tax=Rhodovulum sp. ES.010 TaxID=1882821 RepID=UPI00092CC311|nr:ribonuclease J [Rhodovulum sp. ES.010]SIO27625.1 ribonuclease J [Rhodovulum sp. ES.010]